MHSIQRTIYIVVGPLHSCRPLLTATIITPLSVHGFWSNGQRFIYILCFSLKQIVEFVFTSGSLLNRSKL